MRVTFVRSVLLVASCMASTLSIAAATQESVLTQAAQLFGEPLNAEHRAYQLNTNYVIWLIFDPQGELFEVDVGPKSYYSSEFPNAPRATKADSLSEAEYERTLRKISQLKDVGALRRGHEGAIPGDFGLLNTDQFEAAFVDRIVGSDEDQVVKFSVYFLQEHSGSPEQVETLQGQPMVCVVGLWYYAKPATPQMTLGQWQTMQLAGPNLHGIHGCHRTTILHDADGFTIEEPQVVTIVVSEPYRVRVLRGRVTMSDQPVAEANVEVRAVGGRKILRCKTDEEGNFKISHVAQGEYKFKVTKDGFNALSGTITVDHNAPLDRLLFQISLGT